MDFTSAAQKRIRLNAAADAAALAAVTPAMMLQSNSAALTAATNMFNAMAANIGAATVNPPTITHEQRRAGPHRHGQLHGHVDEHVSQRLFVCDQASHTTWPLAGSATATSYSAPNINFYLLLDNSPSMDIAATSAGITTMVNNTSQQGGCALACHETNPAAADVAGNPTGGRQLHAGQNLGVVTRIELMAQATSALMTTAADTEVANNATYQMAIYTFNYNGLNTVYAPSNLPSSNLTAAGTAASTASTCWRSTPTTI